MVDRPIRQQAQVDDKLNKGDYFLGSINPLNDMMGDFKRIVNATDPEALDNGARSYALCRNNIDSTASLLADAAKRLAENWKGEAADAALTKLREMYDSCQEIWRTAENSSMALTEQAGVLRRYRAVANTPGFDTGDDAAKVMTLLNPAGGVLFAGTKNEMAQHLMKELNQDTSNSNDRFPSYMRTEVPNIGEVGDLGQKPRTPNPTDGGGSPGGGGPGGSMPKASFPDPSGGAPGRLGSDTPHGSLPSNPPHGTLPGTGGSHFHGGSGELPGSGFPGDSGGGTGLAGFNPSGGGGVGGGLGAGGVGGLDPLGSGTGIGGLSTGPGGPGAAAGLAGRGFGGGASGSGNRGMMPMAPHGGQGGDEKERERSTWLTEEEDVWSAGDDAAPPVIG